MYYVYPYTNLSEKTGGYGKIGLIQAKFGILLSPIFEKVCYSKGVLGWGS